MSFGSYFRVRSSYKKTKKNLKSFFKHRFFPALEWTDWTYFDISVRGASSDEVAVWMKGEALNAGTMSGLRN